MAFDPYEWEAIDWDDPEDEDGNYAHCLRHGVDEVVVDEVLRGRPVAIKLSPVWAEFVIAAPTPPRTSSGPSYSIDPGNAATGYGP